MPNESRKTGFWGNSVKYGLICVCASAFAEQVKLQLTELSTKEVSYFTWDTESNALARAQDATGRELPRTSTYGIRKDKLYSNDIKLAEATELLYECQVGSADIVIIRVEHNSFSSPEKLLFAFAGHPIQVSRILALKIQNGTVTARRELAKKAASYAWQARVFQPE